MPLSLRPVFIGWITLVIQLPLQLFLTFWAGSFFGSLPIVVGGTLVKTRSSFRSGGEPGASAGARGCPTGFRESTTWGEWRAFQL